VRTRFNLRLRTDPRPLWRKSPSLHRGYETPEVLNQLRSDIAALDKQSRRQAQLRLSNANLQIPATRRRMAVRYKETGSNGGPVRKTRPTLPRRRIMLLGASSPPYDQKRVEKRSRVHENLEFSEAWRQMLRLLNHGHQNLRNCPTQKQRMAQVTDTRCRAFQTWVPI